MAVDIKVARHATGFPSNVIARHYGAHMPSIVAKTATDNGNFVAAGKALDRDTYEEAAVTKFTGEVIALETNGQWLIRVDDPGDACFVYTKPLSPYKEPLDAADEPAFYNAAGDIMRTYQLSKLDKVAVSEDGFDGVPAVGAKITGIKDKKPTIKATQG